MYRNLKNRPLKINLPKVHHWAASTVLNDRKDIYQYSKVYSCWPNCKIWMGSPPMITLFLIFSSIIIWVCSFIITFLRCHFSIEPNASPSLGLPVGRQENCARYLFDVDRDRLCQFILQEFVWDPYQTSSVWRYFTYAFNSLNLVQLLGNLYIYITIAVPFEMVWGSGRTALLLVITSGLGAFTSSIVVSNGFVIGGSVFTQLFLCLQIFSRMFQPGRSNPKSLEWIFITLVFYGSLVILDYVQTHYFYVSTRNFPQWSCSKLKLSYVPTIVGSVVGTLTGVGIMTGYRRAPLKQIFLETLLYVVSIGCMIIFSVIRATGIVRPPMCLLDYPSDKCAPLGCSPLATNQAV